MEQAAASGSALGATVSVAELEAALAEARGLAVRREPLEALARAESKRDKLAAQLADAEAEVERLRGALGEVGED
ncbi:MAG: hypothetical protein U0838_13120 [Chloroflexota bacterium]